MANKVDSPKFWDGCYETGGDGWELGGPAPVLQRLLREAPLKRGRVAVPGCGRGHDVGLLAEAGYDAVGFDFSERAAAEARKRGRRVLCRDIFTLAPDYGRTFDAVWEYTCYCAIDPKRRTKYIEVLAALLKRGGELAALFYPVQPKESGEPGSAPGATRPARLQGPPFEVKRREIRPRLGKYFEVISIEPPPDSVERRRGAELLVRARRR